MGNKRGAFRSVACTRCGKWVRRDQAFCDENGDCWCDEHKQRGWLMNYGIRQKYPTIYFGKFAMGDDNDEETWKLAVFLGSDEMIDAAVASLGLTDKKDDEVL